jgi:hypothetical protein
MSSDRLRELYLAWWKDSFGSVPNNQATAMATAWGQHLLDTAPAVTDDRKPLWQVMRDIDLEYTEAGIEALPYAAMLEAIAERIEVEPSIVKFSGVAAFLRAEARRYERGEA